MPKFIIPLFFFIIFLTTDARIHLKPELASSPSPSSNPISLHTQSISISNSTSSHTKSKPELAPSPSPSSNPISLHTKSNSVSNSTSSHAKSKSSISTSPHAKLTPPSSNSTISSHAKPTLPPKSQPALPPKSKPTSPPKSKSQPKSKSKPKPKPKATLKPKPSKKNATSSTYQFANHFCLSRRLDVKTTFCLQVLRSSPTSTKANDNLALLTIAANSAIEFSNKNIVSLKKLSDKKATKSDLKTAVKDCVSAYEGYLKQFKTLVNEAKVEARLASYDSELAKLEINRCVKALGKTKNDEIEEGNKDAWDYASLAQNIADAIE
ncbi:hypothetical protein CASFOL_021966 [Castilleja foliolosa]|uniref:Pectinesterase inhibitor domain-containing protein n=1 Tax=Castilleja foliolosa TaxID=1961234 RepID=A0ABD3CZN2_9LAMI